MNKICRLCLSVPEDMACKLGKETKIFDKLSSLNIQIVINKSLPSLVCCFCTKTLDEFSSYRENVLQNQNILIDQLQKSKAKAKNILKYKNIKTEVDIENNIEQSFDCEIKVVKNTECVPIELESETPSKFSSGNNEPIRCKSIETTSKTKRNKTTQKEQSHVILDKDKTHGNYTPDNIMQNKKRKIKIKLENQTKKANKRHWKSDVSKNILNYKYEIDISTKAEKNIPEENFTDINYDKHNNTDVNIIENATFVKHEIVVEIRDNKCLTCFQYLPSNSELIKHYRTTHYYDKENGETDFIHNNSRVDENNEIAMEKSRPYNCKVCGRTFPSVYAIIRHSRAHSDSSLSCSHGCGYSTSYKGALADHEKRHEKDFRYKCGACGAGFQVKTWYDQHQNIHNNVKPFVCDNCGMAFHMNRYLTSHRASVHAETVKGVRRFCPHCDLAFDNTPSFKTHLEEHTGKRKYLCALCGKECSSGDQLKHHNNSHLGLKPFTCSICNKRFAKKFNLSVHQRAHAGEKHLCLECGKHFAQRSTLFRHTRRCHPESRECASKSEATINK